MGTSRSTFSIESKCWIHRQRRLWLGNEILGFHPQAGSRALAIGLREDTVELRVAAKAGFKHRFSYRFLFRATIRLPKSRQPQRVPIAAQRHAHLSAKNPTKISFADSAALRELSHFFI